MARNLHHPFFSVVIAVVAILLASPSNSFAAGNPAGRSLWSLPERAVYGLLSVPVKLGQKVFPRTTANVRNYAQGATKTAGNVVQGVGKVGKRIVKGTAETVETTAKSVGNAVGTVAGTAIRVARGR